MANTKKFAVKNGLTTPNVGFLSPDETKTITATMLNSGMLSFTGTTGQLFSVTDSMTGTIFAVNDISGIPSIEVDDTGTIRFAELTGNVLIGTATDDATNKLQVNGAVKSTSLTVSGGNLNVSALTASKVVFTDASKNLTTTGTVAVAQGGTGLSTIAARSIPVANTLDTYTTVTPSAGQSIRINAGNTAWEAYTPSTGTVTSVALSAPAMFTVTGSPVTGSGTLALSYSGTALPIANGGTAATTSAGALTSLGAQATLVSGTNIKTVNSTTLLGSGNIAISATATGGGTDQIFWENSTIVTTNYTVTSGKNAITAGPITVNNGVVITVPNDSTWTIV